MFFTKMKHLFRSIREQGDAFMGCGFFPTPTPPAVTVFVSRKRKGGGKRHPLFDLFLHSRHSLSLRVLKPVGGATKVAQHIMTLVMQEDVLHL